MNPPTHEEIRNCMLRLAKERGPAKSICPSEVARALNPKEWRDTMRDVRHVAIELCNEGRIEVLQKGARVNPLTARGPIRLRWLS